MTDTAALYRTVVRLAAMDDTTVTLVIPATDFDQIVFPKDNVHIPRWLLSKEIGYRFFALVPILAETPKQVTLWNCENDPRTLAEQAADSEPNQPTTEPTWDDVWAAIGREVWKLAPQDFQDSAHRDLVFGTCWQNIMEAVQNGIYAVAALPDEDQG